MSIVVRVDGLEKLNRALASVEESVRGQALKDAVEQGGEVVRSEAARIVPVDTGNLRASLFVEEAQVTATGASTRVGPSRQAPYGIYVEYGTYKMRAQPYMRPAADTERKKVGQVVKETLERALRAAL